jgi:hypothetical protein
MLFGRLAWYQWLLAAVSTHRSAYSVQQAIGRIETDYSAPSVPSKEHKPGIPQHERGFGV